MQRKRPTTTVPSSPVGSLDQKQGHATPQDRPATLFLSLEKVSFPALIHRLKQDPRVCGVVLFGSATETTFGPSSDYDLAVVVRIPDFMLNSLLTTVDGRPCDIVFVAGDDVEKWVSERRLPSSDYWQQGLRRWVVEGQILYDRDNLLRQLRTISEAESWFASPTVADLQAMWYAGYYRVKQLERYLRTEHPATEMYVDLRVGLFLHQAVLFYFAVRDHPWTGIRRALDWVKSNDPQFFALIRRCLDEHDREAKLQACSLLFDEAMRPFGTWPENATGLAFKGGMSVTREDVEAASILVRDLFAPSRETTS